ncbi:hypothetical protein [Herpetosiphon llansteffanensis]|uniref:hypothetical protein n=1 Tax=Herpetosiphon llansteffanensis TaxID=2094568 RepID=UPI000D7CFCED|nr:hypothetical protein [Herpetosiphon llansteffanensis]
MQRFRQSSILIILTMALFGLGGLLIAQWLRPDRSPRTWTGGNILANADWQSAADNGIPDGWTGNGLKRADTTNGYVLDDTYSLQLYGVNSFARSPRLTAQAGQRYRLGFQALIDPGTQRSSVGAQIQVWVHWVDAAGDDIRLDKQEPILLGFDSQGAPTWTPILLETEPSPSQAAWVAISIHALSDDTIYLDNLSMAAAGIYIEPYPQGAVAAVSFSVDWETAMGGAIHSLSLPTDAISSATSLGLQARQGTHNLLDLFAPHQIRGTWFGNGYNFLFGNQERRTWMGDPTFAWAASTPRRWQTIDWSQTPWFSHDPYGTVESDPAWYFGDLLAPLHAAQQTIESHTFSHMYVGFAQANELASDSSAWHELAISQGLAPASSLAFPYGGSDGVTEAHWQTLRAAGIRTVVRTRVLDATNLQRGLNDRHLLIDRRWWQPRQLPGHDLVALPDVYLTPQTALTATTYLQQAMASGGVIDIYAHNYEIYNPAQIAVWQTAIQQAVAAQAWIATVPEIADRWRALKSIQLTIEQTPEQLQIRLANQSRFDLAQLSLRLPAESIGSDKGSFDQAQHRLILDLPANSAEEITIWLKPSTPHVP